MSIYLFLLLVPVLASTGTLWNSRDQVNVVHEFQTSKPIYLLEDDLSVPVDSFVSTADDVPAPWLPDMSREQLTMRCNVKGRPAVFYAIGFSFPRQLVASEVGVKKRRFAEFNSVRKGKNSLSYKYEPNFEGEEQYFRHYAQSCFAFTKRKGGWDCFRHYEIMAMGTLPYFLGNDRFHNRTLPFLPHSLLDRALSFPGVKVESGPPPDYDVKRFKVSKKDFDFDEYRRLANEVLEFTRNRLTTDRMAGYVLHMSGNPNAKSVLYLSGFLQDKHNGDYMNDLTFHGFRTLLGHRVVDPYKLWWMYKDPTLTPEKQSEIRHGTWGQGFAYCFSLEDDPRIDRENIVERIRAHEWDVVVYGRIHKEFHRMIHGKKMKEPGFWSEVKAAYKKTEIIFLDGDDDMFDQPHSDWDWVPKPMLNDLRKLVVEFSTYGQYFRRELYPTCDPFFPQRV